MSWDKNRQRPPVKNTTARRKGKKGKSIFKRLILFVLSLILIPGLLLTAVVGFFFYTAPPLDDLYKEFRKPAVVIKDNQNNVLGIYGDYFTHIVTLSQLPKYVPLAFMAVEDRRFYQHPGVDIWSIGRAFIKNRLAGRVVQGGSSLTQQLAKQILIVNKHFDYRDQSYKRKIRELVLAIQLERKLSKDEILTLYLNRMYFGAGAYGIDAASQHYFKKPATQLTVFEVALLAGLLKAPSKYSPHSNYDLSLKRTKTVLKLMEECGYIKDYNKTYEEKKPLAIPDRNLRYFTDWIYDSISLYIDPEQQTDIEVITTFDADLQKKALEACQKIMQTEGAALNVKEVALVLMLPSGAVKALIGGIDHSASQFNRVTQAHRQGGSAIKPLIYLAALENGFKMTDYIDDTPFKKGKWSPSNFHWKARGEVTLLEALTYSVNAVPIRLTEKIGVPRVKAMLERLGIYSHQPDDLTIALGSGDVNLMDLTAAYASFSNDGYVANPYGITLIKDKKGDILYQRVDTKGKKVMTDDSLEQMRIALKAIVQHGTGRRANIGDRISGKTGSNKNSDAWFLGYYEEPGHAAEDDNDFDSPGRKFAFGVWVGNDRNEDMNRRSMGGRIPAMIIKEFFS